MSRPLVPGLIAEGRSDELFLAPLIQRQLRAFLTSASLKHDVELMEVEVAEIRTVADQMRVREEVERLADGCHIVFIHHDHRERSKADKLLTLECWDKTVRPVVLIPKIETEAWMLADAEAFREVRGANVNVLPTPPKAVEGVKDPKVVLRQVVAGTGMEDDDCRSSLARHIDLKKLAAVPAYRMWLDETQQALKGLGYL
ncbi:DUF4276 family protein [Sphaerimonospora thailandensis]|uniref:DUF4276 family protein n=1 Tax=Sphaerimonospora thailandensis TaxID=795644 RepID=A0A8J3W022_9ACTN|nr:DUF4276 family protein [Sphaerimonospora thailandensis]GIH70638.1 hypothetical protein Mth01_28910 [Sphaerimonospora thailandensis]